MTVVIKALKKGKRKMFQTQEHIDEVFVKWAKEQKRQIELLMNNGFSEEEAKYILLLQKITLKQR